MLPQTLEGMWEDIRAYDAELAGHRVRLILLAPAASQAPSQITPAPNQVMLNAMREAEQVQQGMNPKRGLDSVDIIRAGRSGEMYEDECSE